MNPIGQETLQLRDIHMPAAPDPWPPAPGWWVLAALVLGLLAWGAWTLLKYARVRRQQNRILAMLRALEQSGGAVATPGFLAEISRLTRRLALMRYPRREIASLSGEEWLAFLDRSGGDGLFTDGPGRILSDGPYRRELKGQVEVDALVALVRRWVKRNAGGRYAS